jgi:hypothetical protein
MRRMPGEEPVAPPPNPNGMPGAEPGMTPGGMGQPGMPGVGGAPAANTNEISSVELVCRSVDVEMNGVKIAREVVPFALQAELSASPLFNSTNIVLSPQVTPDDANMTFSFGVTLGLKRPLKL